MTESGVEEYLAAGSRKNKKRTERYEEGNQVIIKSEDELEAFVRCSVEKLNEGKFAVYGKVSKGFAEAVKEASGEIIDIMGYYKELSANDLWHLYREHKNPKEKGDMPLTIADIVNAIKNMENGIIESAVVRSNGTKAIIVSNKINGGIVISIELASKSCGSVRLKTEWKNDFEKYHLIYRKSDANSVEGKNPEATRFAIASSNSIISNEFSNDNRGNNENTEK